MKTNLLKYKQHILNTSFNKIQSEFNGNYGITLLDDNLEKFDFYLRKLTFTFPRLSEFLWKFKPEKISDKLIIRKLNISTYINIVKEDTIIFRVTHVFIEFFMYYELINKELMNNFEDFQFLAKEVQFNIIFTIITKFVSRYAFVDKNYYKEVIDTAHSEKKITYIVNFWGTAPILPAFFSYHHSKKRKQLYQKIYLKYFKNKVNYDGYFFKKMVLQKKHREKFLNFLSEYNVILLANKDFVINKFPDKFVTKHFSFGHDGDAIRSRELIFKKIYNYVKRLKNIERYIILSQCTGEVAFLISCKLRKRNIHIKHADIGQALNFWLPSKAYHRTPFNKFINK